MADFHPLLGRTVAKRPDQNAEARRTVYDPASAARPSAEPEVACESAAPDRDITRVETSYAGTEAAVDATMLPSGGGPATISVAPEAPPVDERRRLAYNAAAGGAANLVKVGIQLVLLPVMARLLGPAEFGLYALALPTISFFTVLADGGLGTSLAREEEAATSVWSTAFWALLASCTLIALVTIAGGVMLAHLSHQPRLAGIMALLSLSFPLLAISAPPAARLVRRGNLVVHSVGDLASTLIGASVAVALAALGAGAWALAVQYVLGFVVRCIILNAAAFEMPTLEFRLASLWPHAATGGSLIGSRLSEFSGRLVENLLFGRLFGPATLGTYTFANQTSRFLCEAAGNPLWGALYSHALREDARKVEPLHNTLSRLLASALFPAAALMVASAPQVFDIVLGPRWAQAAVLVQVLVPFYALNAVAAQCGAIMLANGRNASLFWTLTGLSAGRILAVLVGPLAGPIGTAWGVDAANAAYAAVMLTSIGATTGSSAWPLVRQLLPPLVAGAVAGAVCHELIGLRPESLAWTVTSLSLGGCAYLAGMILLQGRRLMADAFAIRRVVFSRR